jgi:glycosyltransferase involved in cell wall biosynthesis
MRVAIATHGVFPDTVGGMERHSFNLARHLQEVGVEVDLLAPRPDRGTSFPFPVHHLPWPRRPLWLWSNHAYSRRVGRWIDERKPDIAFSQGFNLWSYLPRRAVPAVFHPHGLEMYGSHQGPLERLRSVPFRKIVEQHARNSDAVVSLGGRLTEMLTSRVGTEPGKIVEIPNAVNLEEFPPSSFPKDERSLLFVGRLAFNKGIDILERVMKRLEGVPFSLTLVGDGPFRSIAERMSREDRRVRYLERASERDLHEAYLRSEGLLFASRFEGMPTVILEAMASRCAVVATRIGAVETMVGSVNGVLAEPDEKSLESAIRNYLDLSGERRKRMGEEGRAIVERKFDWKKVTPLYVELFARLKRSGRA